MNNISSLIVSRVERKLDHSSDFNETVVEIQNVVNISAAQFIFQLPCEATVNVLNKFYYSSEHCNFFNLEVNLIVTYPYNIPILTHYFDNHTLLDDINSALELKIIQTKLTPLQVSTGEYDQLLAIESQSTYDLETILNASLNQEKVYDSISTVVWEKFLTLASHTNDFNVFSVYNWLTALCTAISVINTFILVILCFRLKAMRFFLLTQRSSAMADYVFKLPTTTTGPISPVSYTHLTLPTILRV